MKYQILGLLVAILSLSTIAIKPGTIVGLREDILNKVRDQYFPLIMLPFQLIDFDNVQDGSVTLSSIMGSLTNENAGNCKISFDEDRDNLLLNTTNSKLRIHTNWAKGDKSGVADFSADIDYITLYLSFSTIKNSDDDLIPQIGIEEVNLFFNEDSYTNDFSCFDCSDSFKRDIEDALTGKMVDSIKDQAITIATGNIANIVNSQLEVLTPQRVPITSDITIDVSSTDKIEVKSEYIAIPIDSTIFLNEDGYNRPVDVPDISIVDPKNPGEMLLFTSNYVYKCIEVIMNKHTIDLNFTVYGQDVLVKVDPNKVPFELSSQEKHMLLHAGGIISISDWNIDLEFGVNTQLDLNLRRGNAYHMVLATPKLVGATFSTVKLSIWGFDFDLSSHLIPFLDQLVASLLNLVFFPQLAVPKLESLPLKANEAFLEFHSNYTELGVSFTYG